MSQIIVVHSSVLKPIITIGRDMQQSKKHLNIIQGDLIDSVVTGTTCFSVHAQHNVDCQRQKCKYWIDHSEGNNCVLIAAQKGPHTLQKIGQIYGLTRMRICQIEKGIYEKVKMLSQ